MLSEIVKAEIKFKNEIAIENPWLFSFITRRGFILNEISELKGKKKKRQKPTSQAEIDSLRIEKEWDAIRLEDLNSWLEEIERVIEFEITTQPTIHSRIV